MTLSFRLALANVADSFLSFYCWLISHSALSYYCSLMNKINWCLSVGSVGVPPFQLRYFYTVRCATVVGQPFRSTVQVCGERLSVLCCLSVQYAPVSYNKLLWYMILWFHSVCVWYIASQLDNFFQPSGSSDVLHYVLH